MSSLLSVKNVFQTAGPRCLRYYFLSPSQLKKSDSNKKVMRSPQAKENIIEYFSACPTFNKEVETLPKTLLRRCKKSENLYLMDEKIAKKIVNCFKNDIVGNGAPVFESNPGLGLVTKELLKAGVPSVSVFELEKNFKFFPKQLIFQYPTKLRFFYSNFLQLWTISYSDLTKDDNKLKGVMNVVKTKSWNDGISLNMLTPLTNPKFLQHLIYSIVFQSGVIPYGRPQIFLILSPIVLRLLKNESKSLHMGSNYKFTVVCNLFFDIDLCDTVDRMAFLPWPSKSDDTNCLSEQHELDDRLLYLVKLTPKRELLADMNPEKVKLLWFFIRHHLNNKNNRIIPKMEEWVPGCGPRLIRNGYGVFTQFSELSPNQLLDLFDDFLLWPEFPSSSFVHAMESTSLKMFSPSDLDIAIGDSAPV